MKRLLILIMLLLCASQAWGLPKSVYVDSSAVGGANTGVSWTAAYTNLDSTIVAARIARGDTIWVADGTYGKCTFDLAVSSTDSIWILKAVDGDSTWDDHGTNTGWAATKGNGQAIFSGTTPVFNITTDNWCFDGRVGAGYGTTAYGFKVAFSDTADNSYLVMVNENVDNTTLKYMDLDGGDEGEVDVYHPRSVCVYVHYVNNSINLNTTIANCYMHDVTDVHIMYMGAKSSVIENCYFEDRIGGDQANGAYIHGESISIQTGRRGANNHIRNNHFRDVSGTGFIVFTNGNAADYHIYGNTFEQTSATYNISNGVVTTSDTPNVDSVYVHHNTFYNIDDHVYGTISVTAANTEWIVYNNLIYLCDESSITGANTHDYNASDVDLGEANNVVVASDPFVDASTGNFLIITGTNLQAGIDVGAEYTPDGAGTARTDPPTIGAYEYDAGAASEKIVWYHPNIGDNANNGTGPTDAVATVSRVAELTNAGDQVYVAGTATEAFVVPDNLLSVTTWPDSQFIINGRVPVTGFTQEAGSTSVKDTTTVTEDGYHSTVRDTYDYTSGNTTVRQGYYDASDGVDNAAYSFILTSTNPTTIDSLRLSLVCAWARANAFDLHIYVTVGGAIPTSAATFKARLTEAIADSVTWSFSGVVLGTIYQSPDFSGILSGETLAGTDTLHVFVLGYGNADTYDILLSASVSNGTYGHPQLIRTYTSGSGAGTKAWKPTQTGATTAWEDNQPRTKVTFANLDAADEYTLSGDSLYVTIADTTGWTTNSMSDAIDFNEKFGVTISRVIAKYAQRFALIDGAYGSIYNCAADSVLKGVYVLADTCNIKNNVFAIETADSTITDTAAETDADYNAWVTGFAQDNGTHDIANAANWTTKYTVPPEAWRDKGVDVGLSYNGDAPEIGPVELDALVSSGIYTRRRIFEDGTITPWFSNGTITILYSP